MEIRVFITTKKKKVGQVFNTQERKNVETKIPVTQERKKGTGRHF